MQLLVTCLQSKLTEEYFRFRKIEEILDVYEATCEKANERFQSAYAETVSLNSNLGFGQKQPCLCGQQINQKETPAEAVKQCILVKSVHLLFIDIGFADMKPRSTQEK